MASPQPCHVSSDTPRLEKSEIPTTSESNKFDVVTKFRETISIEKFVSSSEI